MRRRHELIFISLSAHFLSLIFHFFYCRYMPLLRRCQLLPLALFSLIFAICFSLLRFS